MAAALCGKKRLSGRHLGAAGHKTAALFLRRLAGWLCLHIDGIIHDLSFMPGFPFMLLPPVFSCFPPIAMGPSCRGSAATRLLN